MSAPNEVLTKNTERISQAISYPLNPMKEKASGHCKHIFFLNHQTFVNTSERIRDCLLKSDKENDLSIRSGQKKVSAGMIRSLFSLTVCFFDTRCFLTHPVTYVKPLGHSGRMLLTFSAFVSVFSNGQISFTKCCL